MRILVDLHGLDWDEAWEITVATIGYTNHTLLPEALESWPVPLFERLLPRHMQIIYEINARLLEDARENARRRSRTPLVDLADRRAQRPARAHGPARLRRLAQVNGVSALHTELMKQTVFRDLHQLFPDRINNKTNGITPRRWLVQANPGLTQLLREAIGDAFLDRTDRLADLNRARRRSRLPGGASPRSSAPTRRASPSSSASGSASSSIRPRCSTCRSSASTNTSASSSTSSRRSRSTTSSAPIPSGTWAPRVKIFAGKAAPSYWQAKLIIKLINDVAQVVNNDPAVHGLLKVVFLPNYNVSLAETIIPAADLSEQISTAGMEASGTGNMKFALNGALTIGTLDGANVEIREQVGADNIVIFGLTADEVEARRRDRPQSARDHRRHARAVAR